MTEQTYLPTTNYSLTNRLILTLRAKKHSGIENTSILEIEYTYLVIIILKYRDHSLILDSSNRKGKVYPHSTLHRLMARTLNPNSLRVTGSKVARFTPSYIKECSCIDRIHSRTYWSIYHSKLFGCDKINY